MVVVVLFELVIFRSCYFVLSTRFEQVPHQVLRPCLVIERGTRLLLDLECEVRYLYQYGDRGGNKLVPQPDLECLLLDLLAMHPVVQVHQLGPYGILARDRDALDLSGDVTHLLEPLGFDGGEFVLLPGGVRPGVDLEPTLRDDLGQFAQCGLLGLLESVMQLLSESGKGKYLVCVVPGLPTFGICIL